MRSTIERVLRLKKYKKKRKEKKRRKKKKRGNLKEKGRLHRICQRSPVWASGLPLESSGLPGCWRKLLFQDETIEQTEENPVPSLASSENGYLHISIHPGKLKCFKCKHLHCFLKPSCYAEWNCKFFFMTSQKKKNSDLYTLPIFTKTDFFFKKKRKVLVLMT